MTWSRQRELALRQAICEAGRHMYRQGLVVGSDGNLSARLDGDHILITPSGVSKGTVDPDHLLVVDVEGRVCRGAGSKWRPSSEMAMHLEAYRQRPDVGAVIHAHPPMAIACTLAGISLARPVLPEIIYHFVAIPTAPYASPGTPEGAGAIRELIREHDAILLDRHGSLTVGADVAQALTRLEWVEHVAKILLAAHACGPVAELPPEIVRQLLARRRGNKRG
ncbi:MAG: class II aldolase/adducin family protein [Ardenticatenia bacterium]|nr:class II aldolase/adducin family protein [Ardenticatenia bacterium]